MSTFAAVATVVTVAPERQEQGVCPSQSPLLALTLTLTLTLSQFHEI